MYVRDDFELLFTLSSIRLLQDSLDHNCAMQYSDIRHAMSQFGGKLLESASYNKDDDVTTKTCRISCSHHLQPKRHQVTGIKTFHINI